MTNTEQLLGALKQCLKAKGLTYKEVAQQLDLSEASVKRLFSQHSWTLERLETVCELAGVSFYELSRLAEKKRVELPRQLTISQENALAENAELLMCFYCLLNDWPVERFQKTYALSKPAVTKLLTTLDKLQLIELRIGNEVKLLTAQSIDWRADGPLRKLYEKGVREDFMTAKFDQDDEELLFVSGELSRLSVRTIIKKMRLLAREFADLAEIDGNLLAEERTHFGVMVACKPWRLSLMDAKLPQALSGHRRAR